MISMDEFLMKRCKLEDLDKETQENAKKTVEISNKIRTAYGKPMKVNDGIRIKGKNDYGAPKSNHYKGLAIDIDDDNAGTFWKWCMLPAQMEMFKKEGVWLEHGCYTHHKGGTWVHLQIVAPGSKKRIFIPSTDPNPNPAFWNGKYDSKYD
jgi:hypothetical protein